MGSNEAADDFGAQMGLGGGSDPAAAGWAPKAATPPPEPTDPSSAESPDWAGLRSSDPQSGAAWSPWAPSGSEPTTTTPLTPPAAPLPAPTAPPVMPFDGTWPLAASPSGEPLDGTTPADQPTPGFDRGAPAEAAAAAAAAVPSSVIGRASGRGLGGSPRRRRWIAATAVMAAVVAAIVLWRVGGPNEPLLRLPSGPPDSDFDRAADPDTDALSPPTDSPLLILGAVPQGLAYVSLTDNRAAARGSNTFDDGEDPRIIEGPSALLSTAGASASRGVWVMLSADVIDPLERDRFEPFRDIFFGAVEREEISVNGRRAWIDSSSGFNDRRNATITIAPVGRYSVTLSVVGTSTSHALALAELVDLDGDQVVLRQGTATDGIRTVRGDDGGLIDGRALIRYRPDRQVAYSATSPDDGEFDGNAAFATLLQGDGAGGLVDALRPELNGVRFVQVNGAAAIAGHLPNRPEFSVSAVAWNVDGTDIVLITSGTVGETVALAGSVRSATPTERRRIADGASPGDDAPALTVTDELSADHTTALVDGGDVGDSGDRVDIDYAGTGRTWNVTLTTQDDSASELLASFRVNDVVNDQRRLPNESAVVVGDGFDGVYALAFQPDWRSSGTTLLRVETEDGTVIERPLQELVGIDGGAAAIYLPGIVALRTAVIIVDDSVIAEADPVVPA